MPKLIQRGGTIYRVEADGREVPTTREEERARRSAQEQRRTARPSSDRGVVEVDAGALPVSGTVLLKGEFHFEGRKRAVDVVLRIGG